MSEWLYGAWLLAGAWLLKPRQSFLAPNLWIKVFETKTDLTGMYLIEFGCTRFEYLLVLLSYLSADFFACHGAHLLVAAFCHCCLL